MFDAIKKLFGDKNQRLIDRSRQTLLLDKHHGSEIMRSYLPRLGGSLSRMLNGISRYHELQVAERELRGLGDHILADIGIARYDIHRKVWNIHDT